VCTDGAIKTTADQTVAATITHEQRCSKSVAYSGGGCDRLPLFGLTVNFWRIFALFCTLCFAIEPQNPCPKACSDCRCFLSVPYCVNVHPDLSFWDKNDCMLGKGPAPPPHPNPSSTPTAPRPLLNHKYATVLS